MGLIIFESAAYIFFEDLVRKVDARYKTGFLYPFGIGYPQHYFKNSADRGFDIAPGINATAWTPLESGPYQVWGNSFGCFDKEWPLMKRPDVYLAGDSFTWGYAPFDKKFGSIIEKKTSFSVMKCGVAHTGQRHQFSKFKEISLTAGYFPSIVVVNLAGNDIENDFAFPHSKVIDGWLVEDTYLEEKNGHYTVVKVDISDLEKEYYEKSTGWNFIKREISVWLLNYSATWCLVIKAKNNLHFKKGKAEFAAIGRQNFYDIYDYVNTYPMLILQLTLSIFVKYPV